MCHWRHVTCDIHLEGDIRKYIIAIIQSECMISTGGKTIYCIAYSGMLMGEILSIPYSPVKFTHTAPEATVSIYTNDNIYKTLKCRKFNRSRRRKQSPAISVSNVNGNSRLMLKIGRQSQ